MNVNESNFGWSYPAWAFNDPRAPWNEVDYPCLESEGFFDFSMRFNNAKIASDEYDGDGRYCGDDAESIIAYHPKKMIEDLKKYIDKDIATETNKYRLEELKEKRSELECIEFELIEKDLEDFPMNYDDYEEYED